MLFADLKWELMWIKVMYIQSIYIFLFDFATQIPSYSKKAREKTGMQNIFYSLRFLLSNWSQKEHLCKRLNDDEKKHHINSRLRQRCGLICTLYLDSLRCWNYKDDVCRCACKLMQHLLYKRTESQKMTMRPGIHGALHEWRQEPLAHPSDSDSL